MAEIDLNLCRQVKDVWGFQVRKLIEVMQSVTHHCSLKCLMICISILVVVKIRENISKHCLFFPQMTQRLELYAKSLNEVIKPDYEQQIIKSLTGYVTNLHFFSNISFPFTNLSFLRDIRIFSLPLKLVALVLFLFYN